jgi:hypothetical protein
MDPITEALISLNALVMFYRAAARRSSAQIVKYAPNTSKRTFHATRVVIYSDVCTELTRVIARLEEVSASGLEAPR